MCLTVFFNLGGVQQNIDVTEDTEVETTMIAFNGEPLNTDNDFPSGSFSYDGVSYDTYEEFCESNERERRDILILAIQELDKRNLSNTRFRHIVDCMLNHDYSYKSACKDADKVESSSNCWFREN